MGKNMTSGARRLSGNAVTLLITALLCGGSAALIYSGAASRQISNMLISMACYIVMAVSLNLVVGLLGELSLGHAGFMSVGLFTGCLLSIQLAQSVPIGVRMPLSMLLGGVAATLIVVLPFAWGENIFTWLVDKYAATLSGYPHATLSTGNLMFLLGGNWVDESTALIGSITFVFSASGIRLGNMFGLRYKSKAEFAGGVILILLGTKILLEHLGVL